MSGSCTYVYTVYIYTYGQQINILKQQAIERDNKLNQQAGPGQRAQTLYIQQAGINSIFCTFRTREDASESRARADCTWPLSGILRLSSFFRVHYTGVSPHASVTILVAAPQARPYIGSATEETTFTESRRSTGGKRYPDPLPSPVCRIKCFTVFHYNTMHPRSEA